MLLPWLFVSVVAGLIWLVSTNDIAGGVAIGSLLLAWLCNYQLFNAVHMWRMAEWRTAPGRIGLCGIGTSMEVAADTHIMIVSRAVDGAMRLTFVGHNGIAFEIYAGHRRGKRYKQIWRDWFYQGSPAPSLVERLK